jgi:hypothetical protein
MAGIPSRMNQTAREQVLATDLNRIGDLAGRELMDSKLLRSTRADFYKPSTNSFDDFAAVSKAAQATPIAGLTCPPSLDGIAAVFNMALGAGQGELPFTSTSPDQSDYQILRWPAQTLTWPGAGTPDATNPLICLIVATPADGLTDLQSRNILLDPILRTVSPQNVYKTTNPLATISVIAGAAAAAPVPPAVPAGSLALFEVYVPAAVADSTSFLPVRRAWRQIEFPGTSQHGIVKNCVPELSGSLRNLILPTSATAIVHRLVIDGELISFQGYGVVAAVSDANNAPVAAPATNDAVAYLYLCGGRNAPCLNYSYALPNWKPIPVAFIVSLTPPDMLGYPTADLATATPARTFPRAACCYVGVCFSVASGTANVPAFYDGDWIHSLQTITNGTLRFKGFKQANLADLANSYTTFSLAAIPATATAMELQIGFFESGTQNVVFSTSAADADIFARLSSSAAAVLDEALIKLGSGSTIHYKADTSSTNAAMIMAAGWNMNIPRLAR